MFAVIKTGGKQYRVAADQVIQIDKIAGAPGELVAFSDVLLVGGEEVSLGAPMVAGATVAGEVIEQGRSPTIIAFKKRRRQNSRRKRGHRQEFTRVRITEILTEGRKPTQRAAQAAPTPAVEPGSDEPTDTPAAAAGSAAVQTRQETSSAKRKSGGAAEGKPGKTPKDETGGNKS